MLTVQEQNDFAGRAADTDRTATSVINTFFTLWIERSKLVEEERPADIRDFLRLCMQSWIAQPRLQDGMTVDPSHSDDLVRGILDSYEMHALESFSAEEPEGDKVIVPVIVRFSVPVYPNPEKEEFETIEYRRKMLLQCCRENGEWGLDPNSILKQESV
jgi:hypothetical protein